MGGSVGGSVLLRGPGSNCPSSVGFTQLRRKRVPSSQTRLRPAIHVPRDPRRPLVSGRHEPATYEARDLDGMEDGIVAVQEPGKSI